MRLATLAIAVATFGFAGSSPDQHPVNFIWQPGPFGGLVFKVEVSANAWRLMSDGQPLDAKHRNLTDFMKHSISSVVDSSMDQLGPRGCADRWEIFKADPKPDGEIVFYGRCEDGLEI